MPCVRTKSLAKTVSQYPQMGFFQVWECQLCFYFSTVGIFLALVTHCTCCPHHCCHHSRRLRHTPSFSECSGGSHTQTEQLSRIYLEVDKDCMRFKVPGVLHMSLFRCECVKLPQWASSAPFSQSFSVSQVQLMGIQRPLGQAKKGVRHFVLPLPDRVKKKTSRS